MKNKINNIIFNLLGSHYSVKSPDDIKPEMKIEEFLGFDSLDTVELGMAIEEGMGKEVFDEDRDEWETVGDIHKYFESL